jgi:hypothetical protein
VTAPRVEIVVDRLIFHGLRPDEARRAAAAFEARLATLALRPRTPVQARSDPFRAAPSVSVQARSGPALGEAAAGAVADAVFGARR